MKKLLLIFSIVCVLVSGCKKEDPKPEKMYQFSFSSEFKQSEGKLSKAAGEVFGEGDVLQDYVESLTLIIHNPRTGARVFQTRQHSRDNASNFEDAHTTRMCQHGKD